MKVNHYRKYNDWNINSLFLCYCAFHDVFLVLEFEGRHYYNDLFLRLDGHIVWPLKYFNGL